MPYLAEIRLNRIRLDACPLHKFEVEHLATEDIQTGIGRKVPCRECGGEMSLVEANQYVRGYQAAGGDPLKVWAGWKAPGEEIETRCPQCLGRNYVEPRPNDCFDCDLCESVGYVSVTIARRFLNIKELDEC